MPMGLRCRCPQCHQKYEADDELAGQTITCRHCGATVPIPPPTGQPPGPKTTQVVATAAAGETLADRPPTETLPSAPPRPTPVSTPTPTPELRSPTPTPTPKPPAERQALPPVAPPAAEPTPAPPAKAPAPPAKAPAPPAKTPAPAAKTPAPAAKTPAPAAKAPAPARPGTSTAAKSVAPGVRVPAENRCRELAAVPPTANRPGSRLLMRLERKLLFRFARFGIYALIALVFLSLGAGALYVGTKFLPIDATVTYQELAQQRATEGPAAPGSALDDVAVPPLPENLQKHLTGDNLTVLKGWLRPLSASQRREFVANLATVAAEAERTDADHVLDYIRTYPPRKVEKLELAAGRQAERRTGVFGLLGYGLAAAGLVAILILILVLLAIERNTRPLEAPAPPAAP